MIIFVGISSFIAERVRGRYGEGSIKMIIFQLFLLDYLVPLKMKCVSGCVMDEPTASSPAYAALLLAWSAADVVRYAYFGLLQAGIRVDFVKWLR